MGHCSRLKTEIREFSVITINNRRIDNHLLLSLFFVSQLEAFGQLVQALAVVQFDLATPPEEVLQLLDERDLRLHSHVEKLELFIELLSDVWRLGRETEKKRVLIRSGLGWVRDYVAHICN